MKLSPEHRKKISDAHKGKRPSPECMAGAAALAARGGAHRIPHSAETKAKMRALKLGKKLTPEHREKVAAHFRGRKRELGSMKWL
jgi:hypothetical protein